MSDSTVEIDLFSVFQIVLGLAFALALASVLVVPVFGSLYALDADGDGEYDYTQYDLNDSGSSEYVENITTEGSSSLVITFADYKGTVPDEVILYQGDRKIDTDYIDGVEDDSHLVLSGAESGSATIVFASESGGGFAGSAEQTVLDRHEVSLSTTQETATCDRRFVCSRYGGS